MVLFHPDVDDEVKFRIPALRLDSPKEVPWRELQISWLSKVVDHAIWHSGVYTNLTANPSGGAAGLIDDPVRFIIQIPMDEGPFCSLAMSKRGMVVKALHCYSDDTFESASMATGEYSLSSWDHPAFRL